MKKNSITLRAFLVGAFFAAFFAVLTVYLENHHNVCITSTQIPVLSCILVILTVLLINPLCRLVRVVRAFSAVEIMVIFIMGLVSAGLSTFGLAAQLVPISGSLFNSEWDNKQSEWNEYVIPYLNESYFVSEPGIQDVAAEYRTKLTRLTDKQFVYDNAVMVANNSKQAAALEAELAGLPDQNSKNAEKIKAALANAQRHFSESDQNWNNLRARRRDLPEWREVLQVYPPEMEKDEQAADAAEARLIALEEKAFAKVAVFRRGLPRNERAFPGILPLSGDDRRAYFGRLHRLLRGLGALNQIKKNWKLARALPADAVIGPELTAIYSENFTAAAKKLSALCDDSELRTIKSRLDAENKELAAKRVELAARLKSVSMAKAGADRRRAFELDSQSDEVIAEIKGLNQRHQSFKNRLERCHRELDCAENVQALVAAIGKLQEKLLTGRMRGGELAGDTAEILPAFAAIDVSFRRYFLSQIPWHCWLKPLALWGLVIGLTYIVLMSLNVLIFRQWAHNERLTYPLAELAEALTGEPGAAGVPALFRNSLFWIGAAISFGTLGWNLLCATQIVPGLTPFNLTNGWGEYVDKTQFESLRNMKAEIFFVMIGLSFLVPKNISFSLWFFFVVYMVQLLIMVWSGHGQSESSFQWDWWYQSNFRSAQGQGGLLIFSCFVLYKCRKYILCALFPATVAELESGERRELKLSSSAFLICSCGLILMLWLSMGANLLYAILLYAVMLIITIGLIRAVAEGGLLSFQTWASPIHYLRNFFGLNSSWTSASLFAPLMVYYAVLFLDIKACIAPAFANALKLREDFRMKRFSFHVAVSLAVTISALVAVLAALMMSYDRGADNMQSWFYTSLPKGSLFEVIKSIIKDAPAATTDNITWTIGGGLAMGALLFFRQFYFWMPHPIGLIMFVNPLMSSFWFSIFLGWICNVAVTKYGNKDTFHRAKGFFIGLIMGELILMVVSWIVTIAMGTNVSISLNR